jgi:hypothetical protein
MSLRCFPFVFFFDVVSSGSRGAVIHVTVFRYNVAVAACLADAYINFNVIAVHSRRNAVFSML